jgi:hypothetical protein
MPPPLWPNYPPLPAVPAWQLLAEIVFKAHTAGAPNFDLINYLAFKCAANQTGNPPDAAHLLRIQAALNAANLGWWGVVANELDHDV